MTLSRKGEKWFNRFRNFLLLAIAITFLYCYILIIWGNFKVMNSGKEIIIMDAWLFQLLAGCFGCLCLLVMYFLMRLIDPKSDAEWIFSWKNIYRANTNVTNMIQLYDEQGWSKAIFYGAISKKEK